MLRGRKPHYRPSEKPPTPELCSPNVLLPPDDPCPPLLLPMNVALIEPEELEKLDPDDLLPLDDPLLELLDECVMSVSTGPDEDDRSLCVQTPSARNVFVPGM